MPKNPIDARIFMTDSKMSALMSVSCIMGFILIWSMFYAVDATIPKDESTQEPKGCYFSDITHHDIRVICTNIDNAGETVDEIVEVNFIKFNG